MPSTRQFPAEWARQSAIMLTWPHTHSDWAVSLPAVEPVFVNLCREVARQQKLLIICFDQAHRLQIESTLTETNVDLEPIIFHIQPSNDTWARDYGPIGVRQDGQALLLDFQFNGWGHKYPAELDNAINQSLHAVAVFQRTPMTAIDIVLEGGSIDTDGQGTLLTTRTCLLSETRNPQLPQKDIEAVLKATLGVQRILWLSQGFLAGDDTDSHIDMLARFCSVNTLAYVSCEDPDDMHYQALQAMEKELQAFTDQQGQPYKLVPLPLPAAIHDEKGRRLPASYANFLIINGAVLVPQYRDPMDQRVLERLATCFPDREMIGIDCLPLIRQYGSLHCLTMQLPVGVL